VNTVADAVHALEHVFRTVARTRMPGVPVMNPLLKVQALGFEHDADGTHALGVLVTPWFMNLVRLPLQPDAFVLAPGELGVRAIGTRRFHFIGAHETGIGGFEACSLFSPMFEFADQAAAVATASAALKELRTPPATLPPSVPARRGFLFGRAGAVA
jgi:[NiFe] hydrogenase assembly HybE family chaperone